MIKKVFSVYDSKAKLFSTPFYSHNDQTAERDFARAVNDPNTDLYKFSEDYSLMELGQFDDETGSFDLHVAPINHGLGSSFKE